MTQVRIGLIGCGRVAQRVHLRTLTSLGGAAVTCVVDPDEANRERALRHLRQHEAKQENGGNKIESYSDLSTMLERSQVQAVVICTPPATHAALAEQALRAGRHVYVEKPLAAKVEQALPLIETWKGSGLIGAVGLNYRSHPRIEEMRQRLTAHEIGQPVAARGLFSSARRQLPPWKQRRESGGGALLDLASHHVDSLSFLLGSPITQVAASLRDIHSEQDTALLTLRHAHGVESQVMASITAADADRLDLLGDAGMLGFDRFAGRAVQHQGPSRPRTRGERLQAAVGNLIRARDAALPPVEPSHKVALQRFVDAVAGSGKAPQADLLVGLANLRVFEGAQRSAASGGGFEPITMDA